MIAVVGGMCLRLLAVSVELYLWLRFVFPSGCLKDRSYVYLTVLWI